MSPAWLLYLLAFALLAIAVRQVQSVVGHTLHHRARSRRRFDADREVGQPGADLEALRRRAGRWRTNAVLVGVDRLVVQSGTERSRATLAIWAFGLALALFLLLPASSGGPVLRAVASLIGGGALVWAWLARSRARRLVRFGEQLPEVLDVITRSLRAGHPLPVSLGLVAREMPEPAGPEFKLLVDEVAYGRSVNEAVGRLYERVGYPELRFLVAATGIAHQTGGNLAQILGRLSQTLRERFRLRRRVRALSAEGRFSGYALSVLPIVLFGAVNVLSPAYYADFFATEAALPVALTCCALMLAGNVIIFRLVNFKV